MAIPTDDAPLHNVEPPLHEIFLCTGHTAIEHRRQTQSIEQANFKAAKRLDASRPLRRRQDIERLDEQIKQFRLSMIRRRELACSLTHIAGMRELRHIERKTRIV